MSSRSHLSSVFFFNSEIKSLKYSLLLKMLSHFFALFVSNCTRLHSVNEEDLDAVIGLRSWWISAPFNSLLSAFSPTM